MPLSAIQRPLLTVAFLLPGVILALAQPVSAGDWPGWRGPSEMGLVDDPGLVLAWGADQNLRWKAELPKAHNPWSSPVISGGRVFLTTCTFDPADQEVLCFRKDDGKLLWRTRVAPGPWRLEDQRSTYCAQTPVTDGSLLYVAFGSAVVAALDFDGKLVWRRALDRYSFDVAEASSPLLFNDTILLLCDQNDGKSNLLAFDKKTGQTRWEVMRPDQGFSHSTPLLTRIDGEPRLLVSASNAFQGLDPRDGKVLWWCSLRGDVVTPVCSNDIAYVDSGRSNPGLALRVPGNGDVTATHVLWKMGSIGEALSSPIILGDYLYRLCSGNRLLCVELKSGRQVYEENLPGISNWASPIATASRIYFASAGKTVVVKPGPVFEKLATSDLGDENAASPAVSGGLLFLRGQRYLYCIGKP